MYALVGVKTVERTEQVDEASGEGTDEELFTHQVPASSCLLFHQGLCVVWKDCDELKLFMIVSVHFVVFFSLYLCLIAIDSD